MISFNFLTINRKRYLFIDLGLWWMRLGFSDNYPIEHARKDKALIGLSPRPEGEEGNT